MDGGDDGHQFLDIALVLGADEPGYDAVEYLCCFHERVRSLLTVTRTTFARGAFLPQMQTIYCNWWDAEEPRKWTRDIDEQKSKQEKIEIRATRSAACGIRGERKEFSGPPATLKNAQRPARRRRYEMQRNGGTK